VVRIIPAILICVLTFVQASDEPVAPKAGGSDKPLRILFIGNSLTMQNNLPAMIKSLAAGAQPSLKVETAMVAAGGFTLEKHWAGDKALPKIQEGNWDYVVLQEHSGGAVGEVKLDSMQKHMRLFDEAVKKNHGKSLLYMTWPLQKTPEDFEKISAAYLQLGKDLNETVVPVGLARLKAVQADPQLNLYVKDGKHPTPAGTYLAACTFLVTLTKHSAKNLPAKVADPVKAGKMLVELTPEQAAFLQDIADKTVLGGATK